MARLLVKVLTSTFWSGGRLFYQPFRPVHGQDRLASARTTEHARDWLERSPSASFF